MKMVCSMLMHLASRLLNPLKHQGKYIYSLFSLYKSGAISTNILSNFLLLFCMYFVSQNIPYQLKGLAHT